MKQLTNTIVKIGALGAAALFLDVSVRVLFAIATVMVTYDVAGLNAALLCFSMVLATVIAWCWSIQKQMDLLTRVLQVVYFIAPLLPAGFQLSKYW